MDVPVMYSVIDFFCGCGGMGLGFKQSGFKIKGAYDFDKFAVESYRANVGEHVQLRDISTIEGPAKGYADVWTFGFPCQDLSVAGKQAGLYEGKRSSMFFEIMRLLEETGKYAPNNLPKVIMAENVKGLKPYLPVLEEEYAKVGYKAYWTLYNSKYWGVPQSRERYFVVGIREDLPQTFQFPEEQHDFVPKLSSVLEKDVPEKYYIPDEKAAAIIEQAMKKVALKGVHACLTPERVDQRQQGRRAKEEEEPMFTITSQDLHGVISVGNTNPSGRGMNGNVYYAEGISPTLTTNKGEGIKVLYEPQIEIVGKLNQPGHDMRKRVYSPEGISPTIAGSRVDHMPKVIEYQPKFRVRKLTPREYFRLQGFPDSYKFVVSDSQLYKQAGNAVTVTVASGIADSIRGYLNEIASVRPERKQKRA